VRRELVAQPSWLWGATGHLARHRIHRARRPVAPQGEEACATCASVIFSESGDVLHLGRDDALARVPELRDRVTG